MGRFAALHALDATVADMPRLTNLSCPVVPRSSTAPPPGM
jgi:hypothetical protein